MSRGALSVFVHYNNNHHFNEFNYPGGLFVSGLEGFGAEGSSRRPGWQEAARWLLVLQGNWYDLAQHWLISEGNVWINLKLSNIVMEKTK